MSDNQTPAAPQPATSSRGMSFTTLDDGRIRCDFPGLEPLHVVPGELPEELMPLAVDAGIKDRLRGYTNKLSGDARTPVALRALVEVGIANMLKGTWNLERGQGPGGEISMEGEAAHLYRKARAEAKGETYTGTMEDDAMAFSALLDDKKKILRANVSFQAALESVKIERAQRRAAKLAQKEATQTEEDVF